MHDWGIRLTMLLLLLPEVAWTQTVSASYPPKEPAWSKLLRLEAATWARLARTDTDTDEGFLQVEPTFVFERGSGFGINLGTAVRLRMWGTKDGSVFRREDWDTLSDWGQWVRSLKLGSNDAPLGVWLGELDGYSLLSGHLVRRYSNRMNPDYHPAGGFLTGTLGPVYVEAFASDVLGARLMGAELSLDLEHILFGKPEEKARYTLGLSAVHDWGRAGGRTGAVSLAHLDATFVVVVRPEFEAHLIAGWGGRPGEGRAWGAVVGAGVDAGTRSLNMTLRLELRRQQGGFRQGFFGPEHELARFKAVGASGMPVAVAAFPDGFSVSGEARVGWDAVAYGGLHKHLKLSLGAEVFSWGRLDVDGHVAVQLLQRNLEVVLRGWAVGTGQPGARYQGAAEVRLRPSGGALYVLGTSGTQWFPASNGTLRPGTYASLGLGVDDAR
ncbi:hypothetical protein NVS55_33610 [Myxococcus stipitatus]|uniref:hypothetical protein n=1 Tax=Myxococcus stipitatus TaxID=83455 RepID=UPI0031450837